MVQPECFSLSFLQRNLSVFVFRSLSSIKDKHACNYIAYRILVHGSLASCCKMPFLECKMHLVHSGYNLGCKHGGEGCPELSTHRTV